MPSVKITKTFINSLKPPERTTDYFDSDVKGLILRISKTGIISYRLKYYIDRNQKIYTIAKHGAITLLQAKKEAQRLLGLIAQGIDIQEIKKASNKNKDVTLLQFLNDFGYSWYKKNNRGWQRDIQQINYNFKELFDKKISKINNEDFMRKYLDARKESNGWTNETYNRNLARMKGLFTRAVENKYLDTNNLKGIKKLKITTQKIRYLSEQETVRFFTALEEQSELARNIVLVAYYTGLRKNEILSLCWDDIDFDTNQIILKAQNTKANKMRSVPINKKIKHIFESPQTGLIFRNSKGERVTQIEKQWRKLKQKAEIENFRFHDLRHNFCSMLVMKGVPIYTVAQLAGHADVKTTQIYAHLSARC